MKESFAYLKLTVKIICISFVNWTYSVMNYFDGDCDDSIGCFGRMAVLTIIIM